ncbi:MAG: 5-bromo-4-chloroindolyl phosphate hydrolysis family protein [Gemmiger sp.]|uniref:5-bromo-4-chloroindolyl phosphate hydrolysis family protein n=2 Tax=Gemmiger sp. TaxID=2049027 RepID=UPI0025E5B6F5|nr:5-bromo-4-chloroindolyl phosphate hydrolysis family protein [Gemmiger sp.]MBS6782779.1 5-bromo-4-chloroindolyl phosphate hydrolysis family protein [Subdoligranulum variabile]MEE0498126.1 5-bromo-4-chloroindolyl phosphate hydrolysis family protein [Gemmiger sp.]
MPNQNERPKYTDPEHPYSGSGPRYQNNYNRSEYHAGDGPFQFPWWAIVIGFVVWWPLGFIFIGLNTAMKNGKLGGFEEKARVRTQSFGRVNTTPVYDAEVRPLNGSALRRSADPGAQPAAKRLKGAALATGLTVAGVLLLICALAALPSAIYWLPEALTEGGSYWTWLIEDSMPMLMSLTGGIGCLFGGWHIRTSRRMRRKIDKIVGDAKYMYIQDIADALPCSYDKCCKHLENCIDEGLFGPDAYLDMRCKCLVVSQRPPEPTPAPAPKPEKQPEKQTDMPERDQYKKILDELRRVNDAIPDEEMSDKISRLEAVSAKIFEQAKSDPDKLPQMRKFMDYYLPTSLKLLNTYAELDNQGVEGENISESKRRIEQTMDTLVKAFENQLDRLFASDALDVSTDIDVMQNMLRADGLTDDTPFKL